MTALFPAPSMASLTLAEPFGLTLRVIAVQDLVPAGALWIVRVSKLLGNDALEVGDDCLVEWRPSPPPPLVSAILAPARRSAEGPPRCRAEFREVLDPAL